MNDRKYTGCVLICLACVLAAFMYLAIRRRRASPKPVPPRAVGRPATTKQQTKGTPAFGSRVLRRGMRGRDVEILQERLRLAGFVHYAFERGVFDDETEKALIEYQRGTPFLRKMYGFEGIKGEPKNYADAELCAQLFRVPNRRKVLISYTVQKGDTLWKIAVRFGVGPDSLALLNKISNPNALRVGQRLFVICDVSKRQVEEGD